MNNFSKIEYSIGKFHYYFCDEKCLYSTNRVRNNMLYLNCVEKSCRCKAKIKGDNIERTNDINHNHSDHKDKADFERVFFKLKKEVAESSETIRSLHKKALRELGPVSGGMLCWKNVRYTLQRIRSQKMPPCKNLQALDDLLNSNDSVYKSYGILCETEFYQGSTSKQMIFANLVLIKQLPRNFEIYLDATYSVVPFEAQQLMVKF